MVMCYFMMHYVDYSMMYHLIRGQSVIKLYIIYNMLEVSRAPRTCPLSPAPTRTGLPYRAPSCRPWSGCIQPSVFVQSHGDPVNADSDVVGLGFLTARCLCCWTLRIAGQGMVFKWERRAPATKASVPLENVNCQMVEKFVCKLTGNPCLRLARTLKTTKKMLGLYICLL